MESIERVSKQLKILVVDDFPTLRRIVKKFLGQLGFQAVEEAADGNVALSKLRSDKYDLIISGWNMPIMPGIELLKSIRADRALKDIPFIMVTTESSKESVTEAVQAGVTSYLVKPFGAEAVKHRIEEIFAKG